MENMTWAAVIRYNLTTLMMGICDIISKEKKTGLDVWTNGWCWEPERFGPSNNKCRHKEIFHPGYFSNQSNRLVGR